MSYKLQKSALLFAGLAILILLSACSSHSKPPDGDSEGSDWDDGTCGAQLVSEEIAYDDGSAEAGFSLPCKGCTVLQRFERDYPSHYYNSTAQISGVSVFIHSIPKQNNPFQIVLYKRNSDLPHASFQTVYRSERINATQPGTWINFEMEEIIGWSEDVIYAGVEYETSVDEAPMGIVSEGNPVIGVDQTEPQGDAVWTESWIYDGTRWRYANKTASLSGILMIRLKYIYDDAWTDDC